MRGRSPEDGGEPLVFDLEFDGEGFSGDDVSFRSSPLPARRKALIGAGVVGAVLIGVVLARLGDDGAPDAAPATTTAPETTTTVGRATSTVARSTTTTEPYVPAPPFATDPGYRVYLLDTNGSGTTTGVDLTTGERDTIPNPLPFVASTDAGAVFLNWNEAAGRDGTIWSMQNESLVSSVTDGDSRTETGSIPLGTTFSGSDIVGVDGAGRPVLRGPDLGGYAIGSDGQAERIADGVVLSVAPVGSVAVQCDASAQCVLVSSVPGAVTIPVSSSYGSLYYGARPMISPDGRWLGLQDVQFSAGGVQGAVTRVVDLVTGAIVELSSASQAFGPLLAVGWSPDSRFCFYVAEFGLQAYEVATGNRYEVLGTGTNQSTIAGVG